MNKSVKQTQIFVIRRGESLSSIAQNLKKRKLIRSRVLFYLLVKKMGVEKKIEAGDFRLSPSMSLEDIIKTITHGTTDKWVTIIEGLRREEIANVLKKELGISTKKFLNLTKNEEGYLFPDTYLFPQHSSAKLVRNILVRTFEKKYKSVEDAKRNNLSKEDIVTLASLVEKEGKTERDKTIIANILYKRLMNRWPLQVDATVQYALGYWKKRLTPLDLKIDSPFNTYKYVGLPPHPICNPGLVSLKAALMANGDTPYWFYLSDKNGKIYFSITHEEHVDKVQNYLR